MLYLDGQGRHRFSIASTSGRHLRGRSTLRTPPRSRSTTRSTPTTVNLSASTVLERWDRELRVHGERCRNVSHGRYASLHAPTRAPSRSTMARPRARADASVGQWRGFVYLDGSPLTADGGPYHHSDRGQFREAGGCDGGGDGARQRHARSPVTRHLDDHPAPASSEFGGSGHLRGDADGGLRPFTPKDRFGTWPRPTASTSRSSPGSRACSVTTNYNRRADHKSERRSPIVLSPEYFSGGSDLRAAAARPERPRCLVRSTRRPLRSGSNGSPCRKTPL
jgi:hypothetical protein